MNNNPSVKYFEFNKQGTLYTKIENGEIVPTREVYGFCDGERIWINVHKFFHPLVRRGKTFEFLADMNLLNEIKRPENTVHLYRNSHESIGVRLAVEAAVVIAILLVSSNYPSRFIYQLDIQTGEFY